MAQKEKIILTKNKTKLNKHNVDNWRRMFGPLWSALCVSTYLDILFSFKNALRSSSGMSTSLLSNAPLNGINGAPGSFMSIHSLILGNL